MELKDFISKILRNWILILALSLIGLIGALFFNQHQKITFQSSLLLYLKPIATDYYSQLRVQEFSDSFIAFLLQPEIQKEIGKKFQLKKLTPQILRLIVEEEKEEEARIVVSKVAGAIKEESNKFEQEGKGFFKVEILTPVPSLQRIEPQRVLNMIIGFFLGFVFGILVVSTKTYFYPK